VIGLVRAAGKPKAKKEKVKGRTPWADIRKNPVLYIMVLPAVAYWIIFSYIPLGGIVIAFQDFRFDNNMFRNEFIGFENFRWFITGDRFLPLLRLTITYNLLFMVTGLVAAVGLALLLSEMGSKWFKKLSHSLIFLPFFISWVVVSFITFALFSRTGLVPSIAQSVFNTRIDVYTTTWLWPILMPIFSIWKGVGSASIIYLAVITGTDPQLHESARVDGATVWQRMWYVSLPLLRPTIILLTVMGLSGILQGGGEMFFQIIGFRTNLHRYVDVIDAYIFRSLMTPGHAIPFAQNAALGLFQQFVGFVLIMTVNTIIKFTAPEHAIF